MKQKSYAQYRPKMNISSSVLRIILQQKRPDMQLCLLLYNGDTCQWIQPTLHHPDLFITNSSVCQDDFKQGHIPASMRHRQVKLCPSLLSFQKLVSLWNKVRPSPTKKTPQIIFSCRSIPKCVIFRLLDTLLW